MTGAFAGQGLESVLKSIYLPPNFRDAWNAGTGELVEGSIWRADWEDDALIVAIVALKPTLLAVPITLDRAYSDPETLPLAADDSPLGIEAWCWPSLAFVVESHVLGHRVGTLRADVLGRLSAYEAPSTDVHLTDQSRRLFSAMLTDQCGRLKSATWIDAAAETAAAPSLRDRVSIEALVEILDMPTYRALRVLRGTEDLSSPERTTLGNALNIPADELKAPPANPPLALVEAMSGVQRAAQIRTLACQRQLGTAGAYRVAARETFRAAARQTGAQAPDWDQRLDAYFAAQSLDAESS